jgi:hypothetical protein
VGLSLGKQAATNDEKMQRKEFYPKNFQNRKYPANTLIFA